MYLEIDEGFPGNRKTLRLCSLMEDPKAGWYMVWLWTWACRSCQDGDLRGLGAFEIEEAARYQQHDGRLCSAMIASGFIDKSESGEPSGIHNWMKRTGSAIKRMGEKAKENRKRRADAKARYDAGTALNNAGIEEESYRNRTSTIPSKTRQDKTSPDKTSPKKGAATPGIRPDTPDRLLLCIKIAVEKQPKASMWAAEPLATKNADEFLRSLGDVEKALPDLERKIALFAADPDMQPWTVKKFCEKYNGIGLPKLEYGKAPKRSEVPTQTPVLE